MRNLTVNEMYNVTGGASKYVKCPYCGYSKKTNLFERLFYSNSRIKFLLGNKHFSTLGGYIKGTKAHR